MADSIYFNQGNLEGIESKLRGLVYDLESIERALNTVDCSAVAGGDLTFSPSVSLSGVAQKGGVYGDNIRNTVRHYARTIQAYYTYCNRLASAVDKVGNAFVDEENRLRGMQMSEIYQKVSNFLKGVKADLDSICKKFMGIINDMFCLDGDPVNVYNGNYLDEIPLLQVFGPSRMELKLFYNSKLMEYSSLGFGWTHSFTERLFLVEDGLRLMHANMAIEPFARGDDGVFRSSLTYDVISRAEDGYCRETTSGEKRFYDASGLLMWIETPTGGRIDLTYADHAPTSVRDQYGNAFQFEYDEGGRLTAVRDHAGRAAAFEYDGALLTGVTKPDGVKREYGYDDLGRLTVVCGPEHVERMINRYDDENRVVCQEFCDGTRIRFSYENGKTTVTQRNGETVTYFHDELGRHIATVFPDGSREAYTYNDKSQRVGMTDACGNIFARGYSPAGDLLFVENPLNDREEYSYDERHHLTEVLRADGTSMLSEYGEDGRMTRMQDCEGAEVFYGYTDGKLSEVTGADGGTVRFDYNEKGLVSRKTEPSGAATAYEYDDAGRLIRKTDPLGHATCFEYDGCNRKTRVIGADGTEKRFTYDFYGHPLTATDEAGLTETWTYSPMGLCTAYHDKEGRVTQYEYDSMSNVRRVILPNGGVISFEYDRSNRLARRVDPEGAELTYKYDACGRVTEKTVSSEAGKCCAQTFRYSYDACGRLSEIVRPNGLKSRAVYGRNNKITDVSVSDGTYYSYQYDKAGRVVKITGASGDVTQYAYWPTGALRQVIYPTGQKAEYDYYPGGALRTALQPDRTRFEYEYDAAGNMVCRRESAGAELWYSYDSMNRPVTVADNFGHRSEMEYDALGRMTRLTDAEGNATSYTYNPVGRLLQAVFPDGSSVRYGYNVMDEMTAMLEGRYSDEEADAIMRNADGARDGSAALTTWTRNLTGKVTNRVNALGFEEKYRYNALGQLISHADADDNTAVYGYDAEGNVSEIAYGDGRIARFAYDGWNRPVMMSDWTGETRIKYNVDGKPREVVDGSGSRVKYSWKNGRLTQLDYPNGFGLTYAYDQNGSCERIVGVGGKEPLDIRYSVQDGGRRLTRSLDNGMSDIYEYNVSRQLIRLTHLDGHGGSDVTEYAYDPRGNVVRAAQRVERDGKTETCRTDYTYDRMNRLVLAVESPSGKTCRYEYDALGNRVLADESGRPVHYRYNALHQVIDAEREDGGRTAYSYDRRGNRIREQSDDGQTIERTFNAQNHMESVKNSLWGSSAFVRSALGRITAQTDVAKDGTRTEKRFTSDLNRPFNNLLTETSGQNRTDYVWDHAIVAAMGNTGSEWYNCDRQGSVRAVFDRNGALRRQIGYTPFGEPLSDGGTPALGYTGFYRHEASGSWYAQSRDYDPVSASFVSQDQDRYFKHKLPGGVDLYRYCRHNPVLWVDLEGTDCYILYLPEWQDEAVNDRRLLAEQYGLDESQVHIVPVSNNAELTAAWNAMGTENGQTVDIDAVVINSHANHGGLGYNASNDFFDASDVRNLQDKDVGTLVLYGCNAGHRDYQSDNIAVEFSKKVNGADVVASDGTVSMQQADNTYHSNNDRHYRDQRKWFSDLRNRDNYGWQVYRYEDGTVWRTNLNDKEMTVQDMINEARNTHRQRLMC